MKTKIISAMFFTSLTYGAFAQYIEQDNKKWAIAINVNTIEPASDAGFDYNALSERIFINGHKKDNSYCVGLNLAYKIKENCALRLSVKTTNYKIAETRDDREFTPPPSGSYDLGSLDAKQSVITISPGIIWNSNYKKLNFYGGFQLVYKKYSSIIGNTHYTSYDSQSNILIIDSKVYQTEPGGFSVGIGPVTGFSVNVFKNISIGAEFSTVYAYYKTGGAITSIATHILPTYDVGTEVSGQSYQGFGFSSLLTAINIGIKF